MSDSFDACSWQPSTDKKHLQQRATILAAIRKYFQQHQVLEVETPLLSHCGVTDVYLENITAQVSGFSSKLYLQTSPEFAMKRLLAAGSGSIFQICKAFRNDEIGKYHNPEFSMLEWYREGYDHFALIDDVCQLIQHVADELQIALIPIKKLSYYEVFQSHFGINPHDPDFSTINKILANQLPGLELADHEKIQAVFALLIEPKLNRDELTIVHSFPQDQASLARLSFDEYGHQVADRFEVYFNHVELANGFYELTDSHAQLERFQQDNRLRKQLGKEEKNIDMRLINALQQGLPNCAGVALGIDRLMMTLLKLEHIQQTLSFDVSRA